MAKTIMVSNEVYEELKLVKDSKSFSELFKELLIFKGMKNGSGLKNCFGILKKDNEFANIEKGIKRGWADWKKKYA